MNNKKQIAIKQLEGENNRYIRNMKKCDVNKYEIWDKVWGIFLVFGSIVFYYILMGWVWDGERVLYWDDLGEYTLMTNPETTIWEKIFDTSANKTRYVLNVIIIFFYKVVGNNFERIDILLFCWNVFLTIALFFLIYWLIKSTNYYRDICIAGGAALMCACSRFSYYNMTEVFGLMEGSAMLMAVAIVILLIKDNFNFGIKYWITHLLYIIAIYIHERFFVLFGVILVYIIMGILQQKKVSLFIRKLIIVVLMPILFFVQRRFALGERVLDGTGGSTITDTFNLGQFIRFCLNQVGYIIGFNTSGEAYLNGIDKSEVPWSIYVCTCLLFSIWSVIVVIFVRDVMRKKIIYAKMWPPVLILSSIACMIVSSSVTIRVEMRWIYVSWILFVVMIIYMLNEMWHTHTSKQRQKWFLRLLILCITCIIVQENYYREKWTNLYYWGERELASSFVEQIRTGDTLVEKMSIVTSDDVLNWDKNNVIDRCSLYGISVNDVEFVESVHEVDSNAEIILLKLPGENRFCNITDVGSKIWNLKGWYEDGWMEPNTEIRVINDKYSNIQMKFSYWGEVIPNSKIDIYLNGMIIGSVAFDEQNRNPEFVVEDVPEGELKFTLVANYYVIENSGRSEDGRLSCVLEYVRGTEE